MSVYLSSEDARGVLGVKSAITASRILREAGVINQTLSGPSNSWLAEDVVKVRSARRLEALAARRNDPLTFAKEIVRQLRPPGPETVTLSTGEKIPVDSSAVVRDMKTPRGDAALRYLHADAAMIFGVGTLEAAAADLKPDVCRWCYAGARSPWGAVMPTWTEPYRVLLGSSPCLGCRVRFDDTPAKPQKARTASGSPRMAPSVQKATEWRQAAVRLRAAGDTAGADAAERNAQSWLMYGRTGRGW